MTEWLESNASGLAIGALLLAMALAYPAAHLALSRYRRAIKRHMRERTPDAIPKVAEEATPMKPPSSNPPQLIMKERDKSRADQSILSRRALTAPWMATAAYAVAGFVQALTTVIVVFSIEKLEYLPVRTSVQLWIQLWPVLITTYLLVTPTRARSAIAVLIYALVFLLLPTPLRASGIQTPPWYQLVMSWMIFMAPPTLMVLIFLNRRIRAVGPMILAFMLLAAMGVQVAFIALSSGHGFAVASSMARIQNNALVAVVESVLIVVVVFGILGWIVMTKVGRLYQNRRFSDQSLTIDSLWLIFTLFSAIYLSTQGPWAGVIGFLPFVTYAVAAWTARRWISHRTDIKKSAPLALLRVFGSEGTSLGLLGPLSARWRYVGPIQTINGADLAAANLEPHEFLDFLRGRLTRLYIRDAADLTQRVAEQESSPDPDGRYRVNEFFCYDNTWRMTLVRLVKESRAVVMDLRSFSEKNAGCIFEIKTLVNIVPFSRLVLLADATTDVALLTRTLSSAWAEIEPSSPNFDAAHPQISAVRLHTDPRRDIGTIVEALGEAAEGTILSSAIQPSLAAT